MRWTLLVHGAKCVPILSDNNDLARWVTAGSSIERGFDKSSDSPESGWLSAVVESFEQLSRRSRSPFSYAMLYLDQAGEEWELRRHQIFAHG